MQLLPPIIYVSWLAVPCLYIQCLKRPLNDILSLRFLQVMADQPAFGAIVVSFFYCQLICRTWCQYLTINFHHCITAL